MLRVEQAEEERDLNTRFLEQVFEAAPDITMPELAARLVEATGVKAAPAVLSRFLCRLGFTYKKSADGVGMRTR